MRKGSQPQEEIGTRTELQEVLRETGVGVGVGGSLHRHGGREGDRHKDWPRTYPMEGTVGLSEGGVFPSIIFRR